MMFRALHVAAIATALVATAMQADLAAAAHAQTAPAGRQEPGGTVIDAAQGIEWLRKKRVVIARGDARAVREQQEVRADVLTARYRELPDGSAQVWRIDAEGHVRFASPSASAFGEYATYDIDKQSVTISDGEQVSVTTPTSRITARQIDYDIRTRTLIAHGRAAAEEENRRLSADVITVHLRERSDGQSSLQRLEAERDLHLMTPDEDIRADRGTYDLDSGIATLDGSVRIVKGNNELDGCRGEINLKTGVSKLIACRGEADGRVRGMILPETPGKH